MFALGTFTLSKKVAVKDEPPPISRIGRVVTPGVVMSMSRKLIPCCFGTSVLVRTSAKMQSDLSP